MGTGQSWFPFGMVQGAVLTSPTVGVILLLLFVMDVGRQCTGSFCGVMTPSFVAAVASTLMLTVVGVARDMM